MKMTECCNKISMKSDAVSYSNVIKRKNGILFSLSVVLLMLLMMLALSSIGSISFAEEDVLTVQDSIPDHSIPIMTISIDETEGHTIEDMNNSEDHSVRCDGSIDISVPEGFRYCDIENAPHSETKLQLEYISGRGNTTWTYPKKPYKFKLDTKTDLMGLGFGADKHWVLIANYGDHTLMKDRLTGWLGDEIGLEFTPRGVPVDLVMNGEYLGSYLLMEQVRIGENRINIGTPDSQATEPKEITGGYLIQGGSQTDEFDQNKFYTTHGYDLANNTPSFDPSDSECASDAQKEYIRETVQKMEDALFGLDYTDEDGLRYSDYMDIESAAKYWIVMEACLNNDAYETGSTYIYKKKDTFDAGGNMTERGKLYWGPLWDFDFAWGDGDDGEAHGLDLRNAWVVAMMKDEAFRAEAYDAWKVLKEKLEEAAAPGGLIDQYADEVRASQAADQKIWEGTSAYETGYVFSEGVETLKSWILKRVGEIDSELPDAHNDIFKITIKIDGTAVSSDYIKKDYDLTANVVPPERDGYVFVQWLNDEGEPLSGDDSSVKSDMTVIADYVEEDKATRPTEIYFPTDIVCAAFDEGSRASDYSVYPENTQDPSIAWSSSDEGIAQVNQKGEVFFRDTGTVEITAELKSGLKESYTLIIKGSFDDAEDFRIMPSALSVKTGERSQLKYSLVPKLSKLSYIFYESENPEVASVDECGVVTAVAPGKTRVRASSRIFKGEEEFETLEKYIEVTVTDTSGTDDAAADRSETDASGERKSLTGPVVTGLGDRSYTGSYIKPDLCVMLDGKKLVKGMDYELSYSNNRNVGTAKVTIQGIGEYSGSKTVSFRILPKTTTIRSVKSLKKAFRVKWAKRTKQVSGYQVRWSLKANMEGSKYKTVKKAKKIKLTRRKLKSGRKYYVQVRTYKKVNGVKYYSKWSKAKRVRTK